MDTQTSSLPRFDNTYARLPGDFHVAFPPDPVRKPSLIRVNEPLALELGFDIDWLTSDEGLAVLSGNAEPDWASRIATVYAGHQFGHWNPQLGDGRAVLLGEFIAPDGQRYDLQLKGSGPTRFSRGGDGRAPLGPVLREFLIGEAMAAMGVPTTRTLAAVTTGEPVFREAELPGAVLARVARSHIRVGTVQYFAASADREKLAKLLDYVIDRHYPEAREAENRWLELLRQVASRQASLIARWQLLGFIHGVMNTDNMLLSGETIDYGPCAFLDEYDPQKVFSSIDQGGRYAYRNQPAIAHWNLCRLAEAMLVLIDKDTDTAVARANEVLQLFPTEFDDAWRRGLNAKLGISGDSATALGDELLEIMDRTKADFTLTFFALTRLAAGEPLPSALYEFAPGFDDWLGRWRAADPDSRIMARSNPAFIPRNHLVEAAIRAAVAETDFKPFHELLDVVTSPYAWEETKLRFARPPAPEEVVTMTFCGT